MTDDNIIQIITAINDLNKTLEDIRDELSKISNSSLL